MESVFESIRFIEKPFPDQSVTPEQANFIKEHTPENGVYMMIRGEDDSVELVGSIGEYLNAIANTKSSNKHPGIRIGVELAILSNESFTFTSKMVNLEDIEDDPDYPKGTQIGEKVASGKKITIYDDNGNALYTGRILL